VKLQSQTERIVEAGIIPAHVQATSSGQEQALHLHSLPALHAMGNCSKWMMGKPHQAIKDGLRAAS
jgi:hypothetical protein